MTKNKDNRLGKLHEGLSPGEKAALVFASIARLDTAEADRIVATVPIKAYRTLDLDYSDRLSRLSAMASFWGLRHWREMFEMTVAFGMMNHARHAENEDLRTQAFKWFQIVQGRLVALDAVLKDLCDANGVDVEAMRKFADVDGPWEPIGEPTPDAGFGAEILGMLSKLAR